MGTPRTTARNASLAPGWAQEGVSQFWQGGDQLQPLGTSSPVEIETRGKVRHPRETFPYPNLVTASRSLERLRRELGRKSKIGRFFRGVGVLGGSLRPGISHASKEVR